MPMSKNEARLRKRLKNIAAESCHPRSHHAAIIIKDGRTVAESDNYGWMHAEQAAIKNTFQTLKGAVLYTMMFRAKSGTVGDGTPCPECMRAIKAAGIRKVVVYL